MDQTTQPEGSRVVEAQINLFADELPSMDAITRLSHLVHSAEANQLKFAEEVQANMSKTSAKNVLAVGIGLFILGRFQEAVEKLQKAEDRKEKFIYLAFALRQLGRFEEAIQNLQNGLKYQADPLHISLEKAATHRHAKNFDAAEKELKSCANFEKVSAEYHYQLGRLQEMQGLYQEAVNNYMTTLELAPTHPRALFHIAFRADLAGDEETAVRYYKQIVSIAPVYVSALMNLAVLCEDLGRYDKASQCVDKVLECHPNHPRALLFKKDIESSKTMIYDEEKEKKKTRKNQILETPISDFELSVRSRNCLKKMNIDTLGDLLNITEAELLSYKNFGETSLREIKAILETKSLQLGMALEEKQVPAQEVSDHITLEEQGILNKPVDDVQLSVRARKCLQRLNIHTLGELSRKTEAELLGCKNFGVTSLNEIKKMMANFGLSLRTLD
jgi:DNA-directed RNA polymerase subunit alpha